MLSWVHFLSPLYPNLFKIQMDETEKPVTLVFLHEEKPTIRLGSYDRLYLLDKDLSELLFFLVHGNSGTACLQLSDSLRSTR